MREEVGGSRSLEGKTAVSKKARSSVPSGVNEIGEMWKMW